MIDIKVFEFQPAPWMVDAKCKGVNPAIFYPEVGETADRAKAICNGTLGKKLKDGTIIPAQEPCPVREQCLAHAIGNPARERGIWGGYSERERRNIDLYGVPVKPRKSRIVDTPRRPGRKRKRSEPKSYVPVHGTVARYNLEISVNGSPCPKCCEAKARQERATTTYPALAEVLQIISEVHEQHGE